MTEGVPRVLGSPDPEVTARWARYERSRSWRDLWPNLTEPMLARARRSLEDAVRAVLAGTNATLQAASEADCYALQVVAYTTGTGALLGRWIEDGRLSTSERLRRLFARELDQGRRRAARLELGVLPLIDALLARGITPVALKGFHTARAYSEEPGVRVSADVDLLVPPNQIADAEEALRDNGFQATTKQRSHPYKCHWRHVDVDPRMFAIDGVDERDGWEVDLHDSFSFSGVVEHHLDPELHHLAPFAVAGRPLRAPAQPLLTFFLAAHLSLGLKAMRLMRLIDLVRVIRTDVAAGRLNWSVAMEWMHGTHTARVAYPALALAERLAPGTVPPDVLASVGSATTRGMRYAVTKLTPVGSSADRTDLMLHFMWATDARSFARILLSTLSSGEQPSFGALVGTARVAARRLASGALSLRRPDERGSR